MHIVKRHPDWLYAYIGIGQVVNQMASERTIYERLRSHAKEQNENELMAKLNTITPKLDADSPEREKSFAENSLFVRRELSRLAGETLMRHLFWDDVVNIFNFDRASSPHLTLTDLSNLILGDQMALARPPYTTFTKDF